MIKASTYAKKISLSVMPRRNELPIKYNPVDPKGMRDVMQKL